MQTQDFNAREIHLQVPSLSTITCRETAERLQEAVLRLKAAKYMEHGRCASRRSVSHTCVHRAYYFPLRRDATPRRVTTRRNSSEGSFAIAHNFVRR